MCSPAFVCVSESLDDPGASFPPPCAALSDAAGRQRIFLCPVLLISLH